jgi:hypothetical protein
MVRAHALQGAVSRLTGPLWLPLAALFLRFGLGYRIEGLREVRRQARDLRDGSPGPLLICANHLTMIDSFLVSWALAPTSGYLVRFHELPWNLPEARNFAASWWSRILSYLAKCIPIVRGGSREDAAAVLARVTHLVRRGETALVFPEGGRSRSGRVDTDEPAWGVGRIVGAIPGCRVLCVYLRGRGQESWSSIPARGDRFFVSMACIEPKSDHRGVRRSRDLARQVIAQLARMERDFFDGRQ